MLDLLAQVQMSADVKWILGLMAAAVAGMFYFMKKVLSEVGKHILKEVDDFKKDIRIMHSEGVGELKEIKGHNKDISERMVLVELHNKETKHAIQNLPCNPAEAPAKSKTPVKKEKEHSEEQY